MFCLCPRGLKAWSPRVMDALWFGCIPVLLSDHYVPPLHKLVQWDDVSVTIPEYQVGRENYVCLVPSISNNNIIRWPPSRLSCKASLPRKLPLFNTTSYRWVWFLGVAYNEYYIHIGEPSLDLARPPTALRCLLWCNV